MELNGIALHDIVMKLIGPVDPVGETNADQNRLANLKTLCELVDRLVYTIDAVIPNKNRPEASMMQAGEYADKFLTDLGIKE